MVTAGECDSLLLIQASYGIWRYGEIEVFTWGDRDWKHVQTLDLENESLRSGEIMSENMGDRWQ